LVCEDTRKRKETEQHILSSNISNWEGEPLSSFGKVLYLSSAICLIGNDVSLSLNAYNISQLVNCECDY